MQQVITRLIERFCLQPITRKWGSTALPEELNYVDWFPPFLSPYINAHRGKTFGYLDPGRGVEWCSFFKHHSYLALLGFLRNSFGLKFQGARSTYKQNIVKRHLPEPVSRTDYRVTPQDQLLDIIQSFLPRCVFQPWSKLQLSMGFQYRQWKRRSIKSLQAVIKCNR